MAQLKTEACTVRTFHVLKLWRRTESEASPCRAQHWARPHPCPTTALPGPPWTRVVENNGHVNNRVQKLQLSGPPWARVVSNTGKSTSLSEKSTGEKVSALSDESPCLAQQRARRQPCPGAAAVEPQRSALSEPSPAPVIATTAVWNLRNSAQCALCKPVSVAQQEVQESVEKLNLRHLHVLERQRLQEHALHDDRDVRDRRKLSGASSSSVFCASSASSSPPSSPGSSAPPTEEVVVERWSSSIICSTGTSRTRVSVLTPMPRNGPLRPCRPPPNTTELSNIASNSTSLSGGVIWRRGASYCSGSPGLTPMLCTVV